MGIDIPKALLDAGGWAACAALAFAVVGLFVRGEFVTKAVYQREIDRADKATAQLERQGETNEKVASQMDSLLELLGKLLVFRGRT